MSDDEYTMVLGHNGINFLTLKFESEAAFWAAYKGMIEASYDWKKEQKEKNENSN